MFVMGTMAFGNGAATIGEPGYAEYKHTRNYTNDNQDLATRMPKSVNQKDVSSDEGYEYTRNYDILDVEEPLSYDVENKAGYEEYEYTRNYDILDVK